MIEPEHGSRRQYTTGRPWLDVILVFSAILIAVGSLIIVIQIRLFQFMFFLFGGPLLFIVSILFIVALLSVLLSIRTAWTSRAK